MTRATFPLGLISTSHSLAPLMVPTSPTTRTYSTKLPTPRSLLTLQILQLPLYPNNPYPPKIPQGLGDADYGFAFDELVIPLLQEFDPGNPLVTL